MKKSLLFLSIFLVLVLLTSCGKEGELEAKGIFFTLQEAYDQGYLKASDLDTVANYSNSNIQYSGKLSDDIQKQIKETALIELRNTSEDAKLSDVSIISYYGKYNNCYVVRVGNRFAQYSSNLQEEIVEGVTFLYVDPPILIWIPKNALA
ncbi:MAG: hypothetical protein ACOX40_06990 [Bacilli bacterium]|jgi:hypothetical protein